MLSHGLRDCCILALCSPRQPGLSRRVDVAAEDNVVNTIRVANELGVPFLAVSKIQDGIQIRMRGLNHVFPSPRSLRVRLHHGPSPGWWSQRAPGAYGFAADNLVSARVALHDTTAVTASATENEDLFWGLRGAGLSVGIVLEFEKNAYDIHPDPWTFMTFVYEADKIEEYLEAWNELEDTPVLVMELIYQGCDTAAPQYIEAYRAIGPIHEKPLVNAIDRWDPASMRESYIFAGLVAIETHNTSTFTFESYGRKGVRDLPDDFNAVPPEERNKHNMVAAFLFWSGEDETDLAVTREFRERLQVASCNGEIAHSYVNYAIGGEELP
ncbi:hypothetical protein BDW75DRAFT_243292 [Aspergillus navahoensis]